MRLLIHSPAFLPQVGGLEINVATLAQAYAARGHDVTIWTTTPAAADGGTVPDPRDVTVVRRPSPVAVLRLLGRADVFVHENISLHGAWPLLLVQRPWVVSHHSWYCRSDGRMAWQDRLKRWVLRFADASIAVSEALARDLATPAVVIPNAYRDNLFRRLPEVPRDRELVFVGRLVSDKGADILLRALALLEREGLVPGLTVVGDGPERGALARLAAELGLRERVHFLGTRTGEELVRTLNQHQIQVVPSRYHEPFGIVALEGIACGCAVIGTAGGGLPDAIGPCGLLVPNGDVPALGAAIARLLREPQTRERFATAAPSHLAAHRLDTTSERYLATFAAAIARGSA